MPYNILKNGSKEEEAQHVQVGLVVVWACGFNATLLRFCAFNLA
jgi:hypothetical protein